MTRSRTTATAEVVKNSRTGTIEETKPLIVTITHDKTANQRKQVERRLQWGRSKEKYPPVPRIGSNNDVVTAKSRKRRLGHQRQYMVRDYNI